MSQAQGWDETLPDKGREAWENASQQGKENALEHAADFIDTLPFKGKPVSASQPRAWPREGVFRDDGAPVAGVPEEIKQATSMVAGFILARIPFDVPAVGWVMFKIGHLLQDNFSLIDSDITWH